MNVGVKGIQLGESFHVNSPLDGIGTRFLHRFVQFGQIQPGIPIPRRE